MKKSDIGQLGLFNNKVQDWWEDLWQDMPEYENEPLVHTKHKINVWFDSQKEMDQFSELIGQNITFGTKAIKFPNKTNTTTDKLYVNEDDNTDEP